MWIAMQSTERYFKFVKLGYLWNNFGNRQIKHDNNYYWETLHGPSSQRSLIRDCITLQKTNSHIWVTLAACSTACFSQVMCLAYNEHNFTAPAYLSDFVQRRQHVRPSDQVYRRFPVDCPANKETVWWSGVFSMGAQALELPNPSRPEQYWL